MTQTPLHTERLELVPLADEHFEWEVELDSDPEVMRYLSGRARTREEVTRAHRMRLDTAGAVPGPGFWVGFLDGEFVGWWLLEPAGWGVGQLVRVEAELGYRLLRRYWRRGLAGEGSRELLRHAFQELGMHRVFAETMTANAGSRATMAAVGLQYVRTFPDDRKGVDRLPDSDLGGVEYAITADEWRVAHAGSR